MCRKVRIGSCPEKRKTFVCAREQKVFLGVLRTLFLQKKGPKPPEALKRSIRRRQKKTEITLGPKLFKSVQGDLLEAVEQIVAHRECEVDAAGDALYRFFRYEARSAYFIGDKL